MRFSVDPTSSVPIYAQIVGQVKHALAAGSLHDGDPLPSLREVATRLRINPLTVKKAYGELETLGIVATEHGRGTFITSALNGLGDRYRQEALAQAVDRLLVEAHYLNVSLDEVIATLRERGGLLAVGDRSGCAEALADKQSGAGEISELNSGGQATSR